MSIQTLEEIYPGIPICPSAPVMTIIDNHHTNWRCVLDISIIFGLYKQVSSHIHSLIDKQYLKTFEHLHTFSSIPLTSNNKHVSFINDTGFFLLIISFSDPFSGALQSWLSHEIILRSTHNRSININNSPSSRSYKSKNNHENNHLSSGSTASSSPEQPIKSSVKKHSSSIKSLSSTPLKINKLTSWMLVYS